MKLFTVYSIFIISFFGNFVVDINIVPPHFTIMTEVFIYLLLIISFINKYENKNKLNFHLLPFYSFFILSAICSAVVNRDLSIQPIFSLRLIMRFYVFYLALINLDFSETELKKINKLLIFLFLIQIPATSIKFYLYGFAEKTPGIYGHGGGNTTFMVLISLAYLAGFYIFYKSRKIYILLGICFVFYGIVGFKAALLYLVPFELILILFLAYLRDKQPNIIKYAGITVLILTSIVVISSLVIKLNPRLNPEKKIGGSIKYSYAINYTQDYTTGKDPYNQGIPIGRASTTYEVFKQIWEDGFDKIFLGYGPGSLTTSVLETKKKTKVGQLKIGYGITGMVYIIAEYGIIGLITLIVILFTFIYRTLNWYKYEKDIYWKAVAFGSLIFCIINTIIFLIYNKIPITGDVFPPVFFYTMSLMFNRYQKNTTLIL